MEKIAHLSIPERLNRLEDQIGLGQHQPLAGTYAARINDIEAHVLDQRPTPATSTLMPSPQGAPPGILQRLSRAEELIGIQ